VTEPPDNVIPFPRPGYDADETLTIYGVEAALTHILHLRLNRCNDELRALRLDMMAMTDIDEDLAWIGPMLTAIIADNDAAVEAMWDKGPGNVRR
jgi:hypothetical protein